MPLHCLVGRLHNGDSSPLPLSLSLFRAKLTTYKVPCINTKHLYNIIKNLERLEGPYTCWNRVFGKQNRAAFVMYVYNNNNNDNNNIAFQSQAS